MKRPDNNRGSSSLEDRKRRKVGAFAAAIALLLGAGACRKATTTPSNRTLPYPIADPVSEADKFYSGRQDLMNVRRAIVTLRQAQASDPSNYDLAWRLAKFNYYLGAHSPDETEKDKAFRDGIEAGKLAVQLQDGKPDGHFWLGANYGGSAQTSTLAGLSEVEDIKGEMETVLKLDAAYQSGSAYMVLGEVYLESPSILGGDTQKAIEYLEKGLRLGPDNALLRLHLAKAYVDAHRNEDARKQIDALLTMKPAPGYEPEYNEAVAEAHKLQEKLK